ncbi:MAG: MspA family porin [Gordonia sp. (in: high G+C Gram-positive bacteria)]
MRNPTMRRAATVAAAAVIGVSGLMMTAGNADAARLPNGQKVTKGLDGESAYVERRGESAFPNGTVANNPAARGAILSGTYTTKLGGGINGKETLRVILGCQVDVSGVTLDFSGALSLTALDASAGLSLPLSPGQVAIVEITSKSIDKNAKASIQLSQYSLTVDGCGGYASARTAATVEGANGYEINDDDKVVTGSGTYLKTTLYGKPFSLG